MKILLFGEFSGVHTNLKYGLRKLGHEVTLVSDGDGVKNMTGADVNIRCRSKGRILRGVETRLRFLACLRRLKGYDVVQYIDPFFVRLPFEHHLTYLKLLKKRNGAVFYNGCGNDPYITMTMINQKYSPLHNEVKEECFDGILKKLNVKAICSTLRTYRQFDGIVSSTFTYHDALSRQSNYRGFVPFPARLDVEVPPLDYHGKINIFFGYIRKTFKGANYILQALERLQDEYADRVCVNVVNRVPYDTYIRMFRNSHIFIDQACSSGYGMNTLLGLAAGKVVLSGCEPGMRQLVGVDCPVINILPDAEDIYQNLRSLIDDPGRIKKITGESRAFAERVHDPVEVARKYLQIWTA